ncbi:MAG TPA: MalY/PatB family protein [Amaricoccus sp.]|uniref:MalY/PatB family protein n=1 Tax=Amaricoccus sp. TaxID=1872485 RepID=UPI002CAC1398|nr:MalY/PatB family protein [Amaricoccus sp.]HMQ95034.1 MalY/PatB family protein [Amaricoccus sp.]HMR54802.1 MalY/PatB family protein [Amaricoccus sp.]HMR62087.1 MalY/PatB family protein [Amaricoccus sp.]HMU01818.1 MalY/PatB family protein [Amaricoccus sp.]
MFDFDEIIDNRGTHSDKWDEMEARYGISPEDGLAMWVADMEFRPPSAVNEALAAAVAHGVHGYFGDERDYKAAITGWMARRHGWEVDPSAIATTHGIVAGLAICLRAFTEPGDGVILFTPVYHAFARIIGANRREVVESPLVLRDGRYGMDLDALSGALKGHERMVVLCSPHNPGGRVWDRDELRALADFCRDHDLLLVADEIHHDLIHPGNRHIPMPLAAPDCLDRLVMLTATTKAFNIAGTVTGNVIIPDASLRARFGAAHRATGTSPNRFGMLMATAAYATGDAWIDALCAYLAGNAEVFGTGLDAIPGVRMMPMQGTYLSWVDFSGTGMATEEFTGRVERGARIAASHGPAFGTGGAGHLRFNLAMPRPRIREAVTRLQAAFADLQ